MRKRIVSMLLAGTMVLGSLINTPVLASALPDGTKAESTESTEDAPGYEVETEILSDTEGQQEAPAAPETAVSDTNEKSLEAANTIDSEDSADAVYAAEDPSEGVNLSDPEILQDAITSLPDLSDYAVLSLADQESVDAYVDCLKDSYYEELTTRERSEVDLAQLAALDIYADTLSYFTPDLPEDDEVKEYETVALSDSELSSLQKRIDALPYLEDITDVSRVRLEEGQEESGYVLKFSSADTKMYLSDAKVDALYKEVYDIASTFVLLPDEQSLKIHGSEKVMYLTGFFSVGITGYVSEEDEMASNGEGLLAKVKSMLSGLFTETVYAATTKYGTISKYEKVKYSGSLSSSSWTAGYYEVSMTSTGVSGVAFCANATQDAPGHAGYALTTQTAGTSDIVKCILYYGYGGPGQLSTVANNMNGYLETHFAIHWALNHSTGMYDTVSSNSYNKIYGKLTAAQKAVAIDATSYWMAGTGVSGTQKLVYAKFGNYGNLQLKKNGNVSNSPIGKAVYRVYSDAACTQTIADRNGSYTLTTAANGYSNTLSYPAGTTVYVKEYSAPAGTKKDDAVYTVRIVKDSTVFANSTSGADGWNTDTEYYRFGIVKKDAETGELVYGAKYGIYEDAACTKQTVNLYNNVVYTITTKNAVVTKANVNTLDMADEYFNAIWLSPGKNYWVKEISSPSGYILDPTVYPMTARVDASKNYYIKIKDKETLIYSPNQEKVKTVIIEVEDQPEKKSTGFHIRKQSANPLLTNGNALYSLEGAEYEVYASLDDAKLRRNALSVLKTDDEGVTDEFVVNLKEEEIIDDWKQTYYVREVKASYGYKICHGQYDDGYVLTQNDASEFVVDEESYGIHTVELTKADLEKTKEVNCAEPPVDDPFRAKLYKYNNKTGSLVNINETGRPAIFVMEYWDNLNARVSESPVKRWFYKTDSDAYLEFSDMNGIYGLSEVTFDTENVLDEFKGKTVRSDNYYKNELGINIFPIGTYRIREVSSPEGYLLSGNMEFEGIAGNRSVTDGLTAVIDYNASTEEAFYKVGTSSVTAYNMVLNVKEEPVNTPGSIRLKKSSAEAVLTDGSSLYSLEGASYGIYESQEDALADINAVGVLTTDANGESDVVTFDAVSEDGYQVFVKEIKASKGFALDETVYPVTIYPGEEADAVVVEATEPLIMAPFDARLQKKDADTLEDKPQGDGDFAGAFFALEYRVNAASKNADKTWYFVTDENGVIDFADPAYFRETYTFPVAGESTKQTELSGVTITSDPIPGYAVAVQEDTGNGETVTIYRNCSFDTDGARIMYHPGNFTVKEIAAPRYYSMEGTIGLRGSSKINAAADGITFAVEVSGQMNPDGTGVRYDYFCDGDKLSEASLLVDCYDKLHYGRVNIVKYGKNGKGLSGVTFHLVRVSDNADMGYVKTDKNGDAFFNDLIPGEYVLTETATVEGYDLLKDNIQFTVPWSMTEEEMKLQDADPKKAYFDVSSGTYCFSEITFNVTDSVKFTVPMTGGNGMNMLLMVSAVMFIMMGLYILLNRKKEVTE